MIDVTWYQAAAYCNWLSEQEGIPKEEWCYRPNRAGQFDDGMRLVPGYLTKRGYRLPTEAEWEYACRAGAVTSRYYGETEELLKEYAWYSKTTNDEGVRAGVLLKPNDLGLFDLYGTAYEWTQDPNLGYRWPGHNRYKEDKEFSLYIKDNQSRLLRGGSFGDPAPFVRSANRYPSRPSYVTDAAGFREASTSRRTEGPRGRNSEGGIPLRSVPRCEVQAVVRCRAAHERSRPKEMLARRVW